MAGQPKAPFYIILAVVVFGLVALGAYNLGLFGGGDDPVADGPNGGGGGDGNGGLRPANTLPGGINPTQPGTPDAREAPDTKGITTVDVYDWQASDKLPPVRGLSAFKSLDETENTVHFALNVWAGWGPIILANDGFKAGKVWKTQAGKEFKVQLVLIDNPVVMRDAYANGDVHIGWATLDMVPLFMEGFVDAQGKPIDSRVMPRIYQQIDWSNGGDGIVVRENIRSVADLRGKRIALAQNSPSHFFLLNMLVAGGVQPAEVTMAFTGDAFQAAAAFNSEPTLAGCVSWAPDIYTLSDVRGNRMLVNTKTASKLIADVWFARADFGKEHPDIVEALVRGIFDGMVDLKDQAKKQRAAELMADGYNIPATDTLAMFEDAHNTNWAENRQFFLNKNNPANFEAIWNKAYYYYRGAGAIEHQPVSFDQVMDFSIIQKLGDDPKYSSQQDEYRTNFAPEAAVKSIIERDEVLTKTVVIHFYPNSDEIYKKVSHDVDGNTVEELYDPNVDFVLKEVAALSAQFAAARIVIEGHTDTSMKGQVPPELVKDLSNRRATAVRQALLEKYQGDLDPNQFGVLGVGWDEPADPNDAQNHAKNRRVEIRVLSAESGAN